MNKNDRVKLDNKVSGTVHGFYTADSEELVVFKPDWNWGRHVWGTLEDGKPSGESFNCAFSLMLVHPSNLTPIT